MVQLMLCRCIRISAQVGEVVVVPTLLCLRIVAEWVSGNKSQVILWTGIGDNSVIGHTVRRQNPTLSDEVSTDTEWGTLHHFMETVSGGGPVFILPLIIVGDLG